METFYMLIPFFRGFGKMAKVCMMTSWLECLFCVQMYFSWVFPSLEVLVSANNCFWNSCNLFPQWEYNSANGVRLWGVWFHKYSFTWYLWGQWSKGWEVKVVEHKHHQTSKPAFVILLILYPRPGKWPSSLWSASFYSCLKYVVSVVSLFSSYTGSSNSGTC